MTADVNQYREHNHPHDDFYLNQLCLVALSGAFGAICLTMSVWNTDYLNRILAPQFHSYVFWSGIALLVMFVARSIVLWRISGKQAEAGHDHTKQDCGSHAVRTSRAALPRQNRVFNKNV